MTCPKYGGYSNISHKCDYAMMKETTAAFNFNNQLSNLKNSLVLWEDVVSKTMKLSLSLKTVIQCVAGFLEAFQRIADSAYNSNSGLRELSSSMTRFCLRERGLESRLRMFNSQLVDCLAAPLADRLEAWRRTVTQLDRESSKEWRRARNDLQRVSCEVERLNRRFRRKNSASVGPSRAFNNSSQTGEESVHLNFMQHDLQLKQQTLTDLERIYLRRAVVEERRRFSELITCLKPVLESQLTLLNDVSAIEECTSSLDNYSLDPNELSSDTEQAIDEAAEHAFARISHPRKLSDMRAAMRFPRSSISGYGGSQLSLQSALSAASAWSSRVSNGTDHSNSHVLSDGSYAAPHNNTIRSPTKCDTSTSTNLGAAAGADALSLFETNGTIDVPPVVNVSTPRADETATPTCHLHSSAHTDVDEDGAGGATTEDTEDGETEDEDRLLSADVTDQGISGPVLYPNQALPAPVYTNLHELKRAAAKKFTLRECTNERIAHELDGSNPSAAPSLCSPVHSLSIDFPAPVLPALDPSVSVFDAKEQHTASPRLGWTESAHPNVPPDGYISTCVTSGTSTFRRKQRVDQPSAGDNEAQGIHSMYGSFTPASNRRANQGFNDSNDREFGRSHTRPANPPRRSSSVTRHRQPAVNPYAQLPFGYSNGIDPGIQRVSSSIFTNADTMLPTSNSQQRDSHQYASVSVPKVPNNSRSIVERLTRLTPPPLARMQAPSKPSQQHPPFGIKVLPNQAIPASGYFSQPPTRYAPRPLFRQASCDAPAPYANRLFPDHNSKHLDGDTNAAVRDDAVTSFIN